MTDPESADAPQGGAKQNAPNPTLARRMLLDRLRKIVRRSPLSPEEIARKVGLDPSTINRWLNGRKKHLRPHDVRGLLVACGLGLDDPTVEELVALAERAGRPGVLGVTQPWMEKLRFDFYVGLEADAVHLVDYEIAIVPGLLQTPAYAEAVIRATEGDISHQDLASRIMVRLKRQALLKCPNEPLRLTAIIDENVLRRGPADRFIMRTQLEYLVGVAQWPNVDVLVIPYRVGLHVGVETGAFVLMEFAGDDAGPVAYSETPTQAVYVEDVEGVGRYRTVTERLLGCALGCTESLDMIGQAAETLRDDE
ncbi:helix-turn-helix domain-containing protein [Cryptosporangium sp. NPDC051539]|uniref:helix-turn-helix domain-containing protein n=1 Tax=Cryptosporangium sp. NPDC051539 TaxID=3363962 RepID=UPI0037A78536